MLPHRLAESAHGLATDRSGAFGELADGGADPNLRSIGRVIRILCAIDSARTSPAALVAIPTLIVVLAFATTASARRLLVGTQAFGKAELVRFTLIERIERASRRALRSVIGHCTGGAILSLWVTRLRQEQARVDLDTRRLVVRPATIVSTALDEALAFAVDTMRQVAAELALSAAVQTARARVANLRLAGD